MTESYKGVPEKSGMERKLLFIELKENTDL
jgi:hypothetical protein